MTDDECIELASAFLDGEVTPDERALVASDPELQALVEELSAVRERLAVTAAVTDAQVRDRNIGAAMAAAAATTSGAPPSLTAARTRRQRRQFSTAVPIAAVASLLVVLLGLGTFLVVRDGGGGSDDVDAVAATAGDSDTAADTPADVAQDRAQLEAGGAEGGDIGGTAETITPEEGPLGTTGEGATAAGQLAPETTAVADALVGGSVTTAGTSDTLGTEETLADATEPTEAPTAAGSGESTATTAQAGAPLRSASPDHHCDARLRAGPPDRDLGALLAVGPVTADGTQRLTYERDQGPGSVALEVDTDTCQVASSLAPPPGS